MTQVHSKNCPHTNLLLMSVAHFVLAITPSTFEGCTIQEWAIELNIPFLGKRKWCNLNPVHNLIRPILWKWRNRAESYLNP